MSKTETNVSTLKVNRGTYANIQANLSNIGENELIITSDKNVPIPTTNDNGKAVVVNASGEYELGSVGTDVVANPTLAGTEANLTGLQVGDTNYKNATLFITPTSNDNGKILTVSGGAWALVTPIVPTGNINITDTNLTNVTNYATAQVVDNNLVAENIKKDVSILGVTGSYEGSGTTDYTITTNLTNCTVSGNNKILANQSNVPIYINAVNGYTPPSWNTGITVSGASYTYDSLNAVILLSNPTGDVTVNVTCSANAYTISLDVTFTGDYYSETFQVRDGRDSSAPLLINLSLQSATLTQSIVCSSGYLYITGGAGDPGNSFRLDSLNSTSNIKIMKEETGSNFASLYRVIGNGTLKARSVYDY